MKVNTDGVLLGVLCGPESPRRILDIGAGTGVISLILAQRFPMAEIRAVEIDESAALTARHNFEQSIFSSRLKLWYSSFQSYFKTRRPDKFDLIISNPPFFIDSLRSDDQSKRIARHTDQVFFEDLFRECAEHLAPHGKLVLIVPLRISDTLLRLALTHGLYLHEQINVSSFHDSIPHREILTFASGFVEAVISNFVIYQKPKEYSGQYRDALKDYFTIF